MLIFRWNAPGNSKHGDFGYTLPRRRRIKRTWNTPTNIALVPIRPGCSEDLRGILSTVRTGTTRGPRHPHCNDQTHVATMANYESPEGPAAWTDQLLRGEGGGFPRRRENSSSLRDALLLYNTVIICIFRCVANTVRHVPRGGRWHLYTIWIPVFTCTGYIGTKLKIVYI